MRCQFILSALVQAAATDPAKAVTNSSTLSNQSFLAAIDLDSMPCEYEGGDQPWGHQCGVIGGVLVSCVEGRCCSEYGYCGGGDAYCPGQPAYSNDVCPHVATTAAPVAYEYGYDYGYEYGYEYYSGRYAYEYGYGYEYYSPYGYENPPNPPPCDDSCQIDLTRLEKFTADYDVLLAQREDPNSDPGAITTSAFPENTPSDHGTVAVHARKLQVKVDNHFEIPEDMEIPSGPDGPDPILTALLGSDVHEELHIDGAHGRASFHLASSILNMCIQVDVPWFQLDNDQMEMNLDQAQQVASMQVQEEGLQVTVDGDSGILIPANFGGQYLVVTADKSYPELVTVGPSGNYATTGTYVVMKFSNYVHSVGSQFDVRACEIDDQSATQTMLAGSAEAREFIAGRIAKHQSRLQALLEPKALNTRFNFIPLQQVLASMVPPAPEHCANEVLAQTAPMGASMFQTGLLGVFSCATGFAVTFGALRKKAVPPANAHLLSA